MNGSSLVPSPRGYPRDFRILGRWVNSYKVLLCVGVYLGVLFAAWLASQQGRSPLAMGLGYLACGLLGLVGARIYHLLVYARRYFGRAADQPLWDGSQGGWNVFGSLLLLGPMSFLIARGFGATAGEFWDPMGGGILLGGFFVRLGCVFNGCCVGRATTLWCGVRLHDVRGIIKRRLPVQYLEMAWWLLGFAMFVWLEPRAYPPGTYALGVLAWYGAGRFWLEPLRESPDLLWGRLRINQVVAGVLAIAAGCGVIIRLWTD
jgi:prolipoprotein diacylglyceryltransferase